MTKRDLFDYQQILKCFEKKPDVGVLKVLRRTARSTTRWLIYTFGRFEEWSPTEQFVVKWVPVALAIAGVILLLGHFGLIRFGE